MFIYLLRLLLPDVAEALLASSFDVENWET